MKKTQTQVVKIKATESSWLRMVRLMGDVVQVTKLASRKNSRNTRVTHFWYATPEAWDEFLNGVEKAASKGQFFNQVFQPLQGTDTAKAAIETAKANQA